MVLSQHCPNKDAETRAVAPGEIKGHESDIAWQYPYLEELAELSGAFPFPCANDYPSQRHPSTPGGNICITKTRLRELGTHYDHPP